MLTDMTHLTDAMDGIHCTPPVRSPASRAAAYSCIFGILLLYAAGAADAIEPERLVRDFGQGQIIIETAAKGCTAVDVYIARSQQQRAQGLMQVSAMHSHEGMIFIYTDKRAISMWMKNTLIPLDMVFADEQGVIVHVHRDAVPHDTSIISSVEPAALVLELNAGSIDIFGITVGDRIISGTL